MAILVGEDDGHGRFHGIEVVRLDLQPRREPGARLVVTRGDEAFSRAILNVAWPRRLLRSGLLISRILSIALLWGLAAVLPAPSWLTPLNAVDEVSDVTPWAAILVITWILAYVITAVTARAVGRALPSLVLSTRNERRSRVSTACAVVGTVVAVLSPLVSVLGERFSERPRLKVVPRQLVVGDPRPDGKQVVHIRVRNEGKQASSLRNVRITIVDWGLVRCCEEPCAAPPPTGGSSPRGLPGRPDAGQTVTLRLLGRSVAPNGGEQSFPQGVAGPDPRTHKGAVYLYRVNVGLTHDDAKEPVELGIGILTLPRTPTPNDVGYYLDHTVTDQATVDCYKKNWKALLHILAGDGARARGLASFEQWMRQAVR